MNSQASKSDVVIEGGEWWRDPWWLEPNWVEQCQCSLEEVARRFTILQAEFPAEWVLSMDEPLDHRFIRSVVLGQSGFQLRHLCDLAARMEGLRDVIGFQSLLRDYKTIDRCDSAEMEMELGWFFSRREYSVSFPVPSKKNPTSDIWVLGNGEEFVVECKGLVVGDEERFVDRVNRLVGIGLLSWIEGTGLGMQFVATYEPTKKVLAGLAGKATPDDVAAWLVSRVKSGVAFGVLSGSLPVRRQVDVGELLLGTAGDVPSSVGVPEVAEWKRLSKLWENGVVRANRQIAASGMLGIAAIRMRSLPSPLAIKAECERRIAEEPHAFSQLAGVLLFPWQNILEYQRPTLFINKRARGQLAALKLLETELDAVLV